MTIYLYIMLRISTGRSKKGHGRRVDPNDTLDDGEGEIGLFCGGFIGLEKFRMAWRG